MVLLVLCRASLLRWKQRDGTDEKPSSDMNPPGFKIELPQAALLLYLGTVPAHCPAEPALLIPVAHRALWDFGCWKQS